MKAIDTKRGQTLRHYEMALQLQHVFIHRSLLESLIKTFELVQSKGCDVTIRDVFEIGLNMQTSNCSIQHKIHTRPRRYPINVIRKHEKRQSNRSTHNNLMPTQYKIQ